MILIVPAYVAVEAVAVIFHDVNLAPVRPVMFYAGAPDGRPCSDIQRHFRAHLDVAVAIIPLVFPVAAEAFHWIP